MLPRERVIEVIEHRVPDRVPIYGWVRSNLEEQLSEAFGSVEEFEDRYEFDYAHIFGGPSSYAADSLSELRDRSDGTIEPRTLLDLPMSDPNDTWWRLIYPYHKSTCEAVKSRNAYVSLHTDGNVLQVLDGIIDLGFDVVHPYQESAGMDLSEYKARYMDSFVAMGGLDVQTTIGFGDFDRLRREIERVLGMFASGGLLFCTPRVRVTHFVQDHCSIEELVFAYDLVYELIRENAA